MRITMEMRTNRSLRRIAFEGFHSEAQAKEAKEELDKRELGRKRERKYREQLSQEMGFGR